MITVATWVTLVRMLCIVPLVIAISTQQYILAGIIFSIACVTDMIDGFIARHYNQVTQLGALLDVCADRLLLASTLSALWWYGGLESFPVWFVLFVLAKEALLIGGSLALLWVNAAPFAGRWSGKCAMAMYIIFCLLLFFTRYTSQYGMIMHGTILLVVITSVYALLDYARVGYQFLIR